jgi:hypothetical protein
MKTLQTYITESRHNSYGAAIANKGYEIETAKFDEFIKQVTPEKEDPNKPFDKTYMGSKDKTKFRVAYPINDKLTLWIVFILKDGEHELSDGCASRIIPYSETNNSGHMENESFIELDNIMKRIVKNNDWPINIKEV